MKYKLQIHIILLILLSLAAIEYFHGQEYKICRYFIYDFIIDGILLGILIHNKKKIFSIVEPDHELLGVKYKEMSSKKMRSYCYWAFSIIVTVMSVIFYMLYSTNEFEEAFSISAPIGTLLRTSHAITTTFIFLCPLSLALTGTIILHKKTRKHKINKKVAI